MNRQWLAIIFLLSAVFILGVSLGVAAQEPSAELSTSVLVSGLEGGSGSTIGPDGALYVPENLAGRIARVDPETGEMTVFASGLPKLIPEAGVGGIMDVVFMDETAYALLTLVAPPDVPGDDIVGIYRIDDADSFTVVADLGQFSIDNPPEPAFFVMTGVPYSMEVYHGNFLVNDGHHNRVLQVTPEGDITELITFDNIVPTGLETSASTDAIYMTVAGPVPHLPENGRVLMFEPGASTADEVASGARLAVDVEYGCCGVLYALAQGEFKDGNPEGSPAEPNTGSLVQVNGDGTFTVLMEKLNQPTSLEIIGDTAYIVMLSGEIWKVEGLSA